jgi:hypothetical protein
MLSQLRNHVSDWLQMRAIRRHGSRVGRKIAGTYTAYWNKARRECPRPMPADATLRDAVSDFSEDRIASFATTQSQLVSKSIAMRLDEREAAGDAVWVAPKDPTASNVNYAGDLWRDFPEIRTYVEQVIGPFLEGYFGAGFKIFYATMYKSFNVDTGPKYSALWHSDGGPGTCVNIMLYIDDTAPCNGALQLMRWSDTLAIFSKERSEMRRRMDIASNKTRAKRDVLCEWYDEEITERYSGRIVQPTGEAGLTIAFSNNTIHRGGFAEPGQQRRAIIFHCYPSHKPTDLSRYEKLGVAKQGAYPKDPAMEF